MPGTVSGRALAISCNVFIAVSIIRSHETWLCRKTQREYIQTCQECQQLAASSVTPAFISSPASQSTHNLFPSCHLKTPKKCCEPAKIRIFRGKALLPPPQPRDGAQRQSPVVAEAISSSVVCPSFILSMPARRIVHMPSLTACSRTASSSTSAPDLTISRRISLVK